MFGYFGRRKLNEPMGGKEEKNEILLYKKKKMFLLLVTSVIGVVAVMMVALLVRLTIATAVRIALISIGILFLFGYGSFDGRFVNTAVRFGQVNGLAPVVRPIEFAVGR